ncbi:tetratricopeptide repeat protein [Billgrantia azerbaijanica]|nr:tetratricopeptide repeat protein [Halomonas azerbaijanica]
MGRANRKRIGRKGWGKQTPEEAIQKAREAAKKSPRDVNVWKVLGERLCNANQYEEAIQALEEALQLDSEDPQALALLGRAEHRLGNVKRAIELLHKAVESQDDYAFAHNYLAYLYRYESNFEKSLKYSKLACVHAPDNFHYYITLGNAYEGLHDFDNARSAYEQSLSINGNNFSALNNLGNIEKAVGNLDAAIRYYEKAHEVSGEYCFAYSNKVVTLHYHPDISAEAITRACRQWNEIFAPKAIVKRAKPKFSSPDKVVRLGLFSDGFRRHPVGYMITRAVSLLSNSSFELFFYTSNNDEDGITAMLKGVARKWKGVQHLSDEAFSELIVHDQIDILLDLTGHNSGNRMLAIAKEPAPVIVKWVGGLINTTGVEAIDYLISDSIETPSGVDSDYSEKLIRLPDDYICYSPPRHAPPVSPLPAKEKGYITLGCFNNPSKINDVVLREWAKILDELDNSRIYLKGMQFSDVSFAQRVKGKLVEFGVEEWRVTVEGPSGHKELLSCYNKVDIALDPWPYSGGLTTCEALLMGVPVVTLPGPTFAGRHSATHLVNAGMPELVVNSWEEYRERAVELASDLDSLATIRQHLRQVLLESPVCDAPRFARHLTTALRAIWQRYCEGKAPAALTFDKEGWATFEGESEPVEIIEPEALEAESNRFRWNFTGKVIVIDSGAKLMRSGAVDGLAKLGAFGIVAFDPASRIATPERFANRDDVQLFPHASLGNGEPATLYATLDPAASATLEPLPAESLEPEQEKATQVLTKLSVNTVSLDSIEGLESLDWLILDEHNDAMAILENGVHALKDTLLLQVRLAFQPTHHNQPSFAQVSHWASQHGFRFYRFNDECHRSLMPESVPAAYRQATELHSADALYLPSHERMASLSDNQRMKLAFLLDTVFGAKDAAYRLLAEADEEKAEQCLFSLGYYKEPREKSGVPDDEKGVSGMAVPDAPFMTSSERTLFKRSLESARNYFEFGSGGSTVWAVEEGLTAYGVESDRQWVSGLKEKLGEFCKVVAVDIGPTREWGYPVSMENSDRFGSYSREIFNHSHGFDLILVDGRFRVACTIAAIQHILANGADPGKARIFIHDFWNRPHYHVVLEFLEVVERSESAGIFKVKDDVDHRQLEKVWADYAAVPA